MDLMQENPNEENKVRNLKTSLIIIIAFAFVLIIIAVIIYTYSLRVADEQFKVKIDGTTNVELAKIENAMIIENNTVYVSIRDVASKMGYEIQNGEYKQYTEDLSSCYAKNKNQLEIVSFKSGSKEIRKYSAPFENSEYKVFELEDSISDRGGKLYINHNDLGKALGITAEYDKKTNTIEFTTLPYLTKIYEDSFPEAYLIKSEDDIGGAELSDAILYHNQKALLSNLVITRNSESQQLGVSKYEDNKLKEVITQRYKTIEFIEGAQDFIVRTEEDKYGIIGSDGITKIKPEYDEIEEIDKNLGLYLYTQNGKKGIVNQSGKNIVYPDYDQIGLDPDYVDLNVSNRFILFNKCIPVKIDKKWGLVDVNGQKIVQTQYDGIGCKTPSSDANTTGIVIIPEMNGIVVEKDEKNEKEGGVIKKYGVINLQGEIIVNIVGEDAQAVTTENKTTYYLIYQNQQIDIVSNWRESNNKISQQQTGDNQGEKQEQNQGQEQVQNSTNFNLTEQMSEEERNRIIQDIYQKMTEEQRQAIQQMSEEERQRVIQQYYEQNYLNVQN